MKMKTKTLLVAAATASALLAGCGHKTDPANASLHTMLKDPKTLTTEQNWCGQQPNPQQIKGCINGMAAELITHSPTMLADVTAPEPWPGKTPAYFQAAARGIFAGKNTAKDNAYVAEDQWCTTRYVLKTRDMSWLNITKPDYSKISASCAAAHGVSVNPF
ncbi:MAG: hypothetical protein M0Z99_20255 [Betaproteobacteria bacterium]|nr:hypothetical protein [Betaproteobacteria bacterium]